VSDVVLEAENLAKTYRLGFFRKRVEAARDVSLQVHRGEIFGFLGPNGAGKTTTIKMLMGLVKPTRGRARVLGKPVPDLEAKRHVGFLPESPYFYDYLSPLEFLDFCGALCNLDSRTRRARARELVEQVGLGHAADRPMRKFSKGMLQRAGLAQALIHDPDVVVLDEPMTGLDPIGRKDVRDLMAELRKRGKTVFFSTHILPDVELVCDRVAIVVGGCVRDIGPLAKLLSPRLLGTEVVTRVAGEAAPRVAQLEGDADVSAFLRAALERGETIEAVSPRRESLEDLFVREAGRAGA